VAHIGHSKEPAISQLEGSYRPAGSLRTHES